MKRIDVLYQIKTLENLIFRNFILDKPSLKTIPTPTQVQIMEYILTHQNEEIYQRDLESILNLRRATVSGVLQTMEKHELIERITSNEDARTKKIILNPQAKEMFLAHRKKILAFEHILLQDLTEEELEVFCKALNKMQDNVLKYTAQKK